MIPEAGKEEVHDVNTNNGVRSPHKISSWNLGHVRSVRDVLPEPAVTYRNICLLKMLPDDDDDDEEKGN